MFSFLNKPPMINKNIMDYYKKSTFESMERLIQNSEIERNKKQFKLYLEDNTDSDDENHYNNDKKNKQYRNIELLKFNNQTTILIFIPLYMFFLSLTLHEIKEVFQKYLK
jgi:type III secretory pathway component EscR